MLCCMVLALLPLAILGAVRGILRRDVEEPLRWRLGRGP